MGHIIHHAIVITTSSPEKAQAAAEYARELGCSVGETAPVTNGYRSILIAPDGSKSGWPASDEGDARRDSMIAWLRAQRYEDGSNSLHWFEAEFGGDERYAEVKRHEWDDRADEGIRLNPRS